MGNILNLNPIASTAIIVAGIIFLVVMRAWYLDRKAARQAGTQQNNPAGGQPAAGATNQADATTVTEAAATAKEGVSWSKIWLTLALVVMMLLGLALWDHYYNNLDGDDWGDISARVIENPLLLVSAAITLIGATWCSIHFLAEPSKWAKYVGAVIVIGLALFGIFPMMTLINGAGGEFIATIDWKSWMPFVFLVGLALVLAGLMTPWMMRGEKK